MKCKVFNIRLTESDAEDSVSTLNKFLQNIKVSRIFASVIDKDTPFWSIVIFYEEIEKADHTPSIEEITFTPTEEKLFEALRRWRNEQATKEGIPPYMVAHNSWLRQIIKMRAKTKEDLIQIKGFGKRRAEKYGDDIIRLIK